MISNSKENNFISAVVYVHNNEGQIEKFIQMLSQLLDNNFLKYEIIMVNDCSSDKTVEKIKEFAERLRNSVVSILNMSYYQGLELSMNAGVDLAIGDFVFEFDCVDVDYSEDVIMQIYYESLKGFDIVSASANRKLKLTSAIFYKLFNKYSNIQYTLETEAFRILSRRAVNRVHSMSKTIPYRKAVYANCGLDIKTLKYVSVREYKQPTSKESRKMKRELATNSLVLYTDLAYRFTSIMTMLMIVVTIAVGVYTVTIFLTGHPIAGWTTLMLFLAFGFFGLFAILSMILKYLVVILNLTFKKQKYVFESIDKISK